MLIAFDMDGTLAHDNKYVSEYTLNTLKMLKKLEHILVPCTGRDFSSCEPWMLDNTICDYGIFGSGSFVYDFGKKKRIYYYPLPNEEIKKVYELSNHYDVDVDIFINGIVFTDRETIEKLSYFLPNQTEEFIETIKKYRKVVENPRDFVDQKIDIERVSIFCAKSNEKKELMKNLEMCKVQVSSSLKDNIEITAMGITKARGLFDLCAHLGIERTEVMMFGDSPNDIEALKFSGVSIAMKNADEEVKKISSVTSKKTNNDDGVADYLRDFFELDFSK